MYNAFFNLRENPFGLNPDPHFLFPSERHRNAFRYLLYGIKCREGFIEIVGDVGTGKTLLCRALLALLGDKVKSALILNPPYSDVEFFEYVMQDLGINQPMESRREVLENLNEFLLNEYHEGRNVIIIIDEAQRLSIELLEQVRLLSNLETEKKKLLQIILVGQPELEDKLRSPKLKQLDQRIALRYYLEPLKKKELKGYIYHRLRVAGSPGDINFTRGALKKIYRFSKGVPRLTNIVCDKTLLTAYFFKKRQITAKHVTIALRSTQKRWSRFPRLVSATFSHAANAFVVLAVLLMLILNLRFYEKIYSWTKKTNPVLSLIKTSVLHRLHMPPQEEAPVNEEASLYEEAPVNEKEAPPDREESPSLPQQVALPAEEVTPPPVVVEEFKPSIPEVVTVKTTDPEVLSFANLLAIWGLDDFQGMEDWQRETDGGLNYEGIAQQHGLNVVQIATDLQELEIINLPCILSQVTEPNGQQVSLVLTGLSDDRALVIHPHEKEVSYAKDDLASRWSGEVIVLWRNIDKLNPLPLSPWRTEPGIEKLEVRLRQLGYFKDYPSPDMQLRKKQRARALMNFQHDHRLKMDGVFGIRSRLVLYTIIDQPFTPTLKREIF